MRFRASISRPEIIHGALLVSLWALLLTASTAHSQPTSAQGSSSTESSADSSPSSPSRSSDAISLTLSLLPESAASSSPALPIQISNAPQFKSLILPEWYPLVRDGFFEMAAYRQLRGPRSDDAEWAQASRKGDNPASVMEGLPSPPLDIPNLPRGFPLGEFDSIARFGEPQSIAAAVLWNATARGLWYQLINSSLSAAVIRDNRLERQVDFSLRRLSVGRTSGTKASAQLFRELLAFSGPDAMKGYRFLTFRFLGSEEDLLWIYSPLLKESRQLTSANRTDELFRLGMSLDDLFVWSGKTELVLPQSVEQVTGFVSFFDREPTPIVKAETGCIRAGRVVVAPQVVAAESDGDAVSERALLSDLETPSGLPESVVFVPRPLLRISLNPRDPFAAHGREILYVDRELQIPVAKVVFDRAGQPWKLVWGSVAIAETADGVRREPYVRHVVIDDLKTKARSTVRTHQIEWCETIPSQVGRELFDPAHLAADEGGKAPSKQNSSEK